MLSGMLFQLNWTPVPTYLEQGSILAVTRLELKKLTTRAYRVRSERWRLEVELLGVNPADSTLLTSKEVAGELSLQASVMVVLEMSIRQTLLCGKALCGYSEDLPCPMSMLRTLIGSFVFNVINASPKLIRHHYYCQPVTLVDLLISLFCLKWRDWINSPARKRQNATCVISLKAVGDGIY